MKHTPGPWSIGKSYTDEICIRESKGQELQAIAVCGSEMLANAKLIAAAPDLLEVCKKMESFINNLPDGGDYELVEEAQQAIKRAGGE